MKRSNHEMTRLVNYAKKASAEELMLDYGIEILEDGKVFDTVEEKTFATIGDWAESVVGDDDDQYDYGSKRGRYDDDDDYF